MYSLLVGSTRLQDLPRKQNPRTRSSFRHAAKARDDGQPSVSELGPCSPPNMYYNSNLNWEVSNFVVDASRDAWIIKRVKKRNRNY